MDTDDDEDKGCIIIASCLTTSKRKHAVILSNVRPFCYFHIVTTAICGFVSLPLHDVLSVKRSSINDVQIFLSLSTLSAFGTN